MLDLWKTTKTTTDYSHFTIAAAVECSSSQAQHNCADGRKRTQGENDRIDDGL